MGQVGQDMAAFLEPREALVAKQPWSIIKLHDADKSFAECVVTDSFEQMGRSEEHETADGDEKL
jgi:hypothetical protein